MYRIWNRHVQTWSEDICNSHWGQSMESNFNPHIPKNSTNMNFNIFFHNNKMKKVNSWRIMKVFTVWITNIGISLNTGHTKNTPYLGFFTINVFILISTVSIDAILPCPMGHRIQIWAQKNWFYLEILVREVGPILVTHMVCSFSSLSFEQIICSTYRMSHRYSAYFST